MVFGPGWLPVAFLKVGRKTGRRPNRDMALCGEARVSDETGREDRLSYYFGSSAAARRSKRL
jgi:hypothetical protein